MEAKMVSAPKSKKSPTGTDKSTLNNKRTQKKKKKQKRSIVSGNANENILDIRDGVFSKSDLDGSDRSSGQNAPEEGNRRDDSCSPVMNDQVPAEEDNRQPKRQSKFKDQTRDTISTDIKRRARPQVKTAFSSSPRTLKKNNTNNNGERNRKIGCKTQKGSLPPIKQQTFVDNTFNESLRWEYYLEDSEAEEERINIYKMNRRKRYLAAQNALLVEANSPDSGSRSSGSSVSLTPSLSSDKDVITLPDLPVPIPRIRSASRSSTTPRPRTPRPQTPRSTTPLSTRLEDIHSESLDKLSPR